MKSKVEATIEQKRQYLFSGSFCVSFISSAIYEIVIHISYEGSDRNQTYTFIDRIGMNKRIHINVEYLFHDESFLCRHSTHYPNC